MKQELKEYIKSLKPEGFPDGNAMVEEGRKMSAYIPWNKNRFLRETGYESWDDYLMDCHKKGKETYQNLVGLPTLEDMVEAVKRFDEFCISSGIEARGIEDCPSVLVALPEEYRKDVSRGTSFVMNGEEDYVVQSEAAPIDVCWGDWHLASPDNLRTTIASIKAGSNRVDNFAQLIWDYMGWTNEKKRFSDMCKSIGLIAAKKDVGMSVGTYPEDGLAGYSMDMVTMLGYTMLEHYIIEDLCGARMTMSYGGLMPELLPRMAYGLACQKLFGKDDLPFISNYNGSTNTAWDHDIEANYGIGAQEMLIEAVINRKYGMAVPHRPVSITEAVRVPTLEELLNITKCGAGAVSRADEWLEFIDFSKFEMLRDLMIQKAQLFYQNMMDAFQEAGVNINDPLELIVIIKRFNPERFELEFHPSIQEFGKMVPYVPTTLYKQTMEKKVQEITVLKEKGLGNKLKGKKIVCVSGDGHAYGLLLIKTLWSEMHLDVVDGGTNMEPVNILDLADEASANMIAISVHCGQALDYAMQLTELAKQRGKTYQIVMGGVLNALLPEHKEPVDVSGLINEMGICASNNFEKQINTFCEQ